MTAKGAICLLSSNLVQKSQFDSAFVNSEFEVRKFQDIQKLADFSKVNCPDFIFFSCELIQTEEHKKLLGLLGAYRAAGTKRILIADESVPKEIVDLFDYVIKEEFSQWVALNSLKYFLRKKERLSYIKSNTNTSVFKYQTDVKLTKIGEFTLVVDAPLSIVKNKLFEVEGPLFENIGISFTSLIPGESTESYLEKGRYLNTFYFQGISEKSAQKIRKAKMFWKD